MLFVDAAIERTDHATYSHFSIRFDDAGAHTMAIHICAMSQGIVKHVVLKDVNNNALVRIARSEAESPGLAIAGTGEINWSISPRERELLCTFFLEYAMKRLKVDNIDFEISPRMARGAKFTVAFQVPWVSNIPSRSGTHREG